MISRIKLSKYSCIHIQCIASDDSDLVKGKTYYTDKFEEGSLIRVFYPDLDYTDLWSSSRFKVLDIKKKLKDFK